MAKIRGLIVCAYHAGPSAALSDFLSGYVHVFRRRSRHQRAKRVKMTVQARHGLPGGVCYDCRVKLFARRKSREIQGFLRSEVSSIARSIRRR